MVYFHFVLSRSFKENSPTLDTLFDKTNLTKLESNVPVILSALKSF